MVVGKFISENLCKSGPTNTKSSSRYPKVLTRHYCLPDRLALGWSDHVKGLEFLARRRGADQQTVHGRGVPDRVLVSWDLHAIVGSPTAI